MQIYLPLLLIKFSFYKDSKTTSYQRQVFGLLDLFGNIGGVNEVLEIAGSLIVGLFSGKIFIFSILSALYQVDAARIGKQDYLNKSMDCSGLIILYKLLDKLIK